MKAEEDTLKLSELYFVSSNKNKYDEVKSILQTFNIRIRLKKMSLQEIQDDLLETIAIEKAKFAFSEIHKPIIVEDAGLFIKSLNGFPGPYSSFVLRTLGNQGILNLVKSSREANFKSVIVYHDKKQIQLFSSSTKGKISKKISGKGWGYDPIFIPFKRKSTYANIADKNSISHRYKSIKKFAQWYLSTPLSND